jgi:polyhydroxyalkanoate synthesis regulator phasin
MSRDIDNTVGEIEEISEVMDEAEGSTELESSASATPSPATDVSNTVADEGTLGLVRDVVDKRAPDTAAAASSATGEDDGLTTDDDLPGETKNEDDYSDVPFNKHPRFQELLRKSNEYKTDAQRYQNVQNFVDKQGLAAQEVHDLLSLGGLMKTNPVAAWQMAKPVVEKLLVAAGEILPADLKAMVEAGDMTLEAAKTVSRSRAEVNSVTATRQFEHTRAETKQQEDAAQAVKDAAETWEANRRQRDPNFAAKIPALQREIAYLLQTEGHPRTPQGVKEQMGRAYKAIAVTAAPAPKPAPKPAITPITGGTVSGNAQPPANSTLDIIYREKAKRAGAAAR